MHRPALRDSKEMWKKLFHCFSNAFVEENHLSLYSDTSVLRTSWNLPSWRLCRQAFMQRKEIMNFQISSIELQGSRIESNLIMCGFRQREVSPHCLCLQEKCTRRSPPLLTPVNSGTGEMFLPVKMTLKASLQISVLSTL